MADYGKIRTLTERRRALKLLASATIAGGVAASNGEEQPACEHVKWVAEVLERMQGIEPGMTREALLRVFTTEGGLVFSGLKRTFVSRDCPYFKIDVEFQAASGTEPRASERDFPAEDGNDVIITVSRPYLQFSIAD